MTESPTHEDLELLREAQVGAERLREEIAKVIVGQDEIVRPMLAAVLAQGHALVIGVPGLAKTLLVRTLAQSLGWSFKRIQFTPDMMPADIIGMELLQEDEHGARRMTFVPGPVFANIVLADEINRTPPKTQAALLEAMQELTVTSMGHAHPLDPPFLVFATQNPIEQEGTYPLPEAQLDRFMFSLWVDYPSKTEEMDIVRATTADVETAVEQIFSKEKMIELQHLARRLPASDHVIDYAVTMARATRPSDSESSQFARQYVEWGAGPRASQHLILGGKALAVLDGAPAVSADHVRQIAPFVLRHRVMPNYGAIGEGVDAARIVAYIVETTEEPMHSLSS